MATILDRFSIFKLWKNKKTLRVRLTAWYVFLLACTLSVFSSYLYLELDRSLLSQLDVALEITALDTLNNVIAESGHPKFQETEQFQANKNNLNHAGFAVRLLDLEGKIWDGFGNYEIVPLYLPKKKGHEKLTDRQTVWRIYNYPLVDRSKKTWGWLEVAQSLDLVYKASEHLLKLMWFGFPLMLFLAALGGLFLADRALRPIDKIIRTAEAIEPNDFTRRIGHQGTADEVGRLAMTIDRMLDRIQLGFDRERRFTSDVSHELRTPLTVIKGRIGVTLTRSRSIDEYTKTLETLEVEADRLIRLANGLLYLARLEQKEIPAKWHSSEVDLSNLLSILVEQMQVLANLKSIQLVDLISSDLIMQGNADYITNLFLNLLDNAIKYTPDTGKVTIKGASAERKIRIDVINTGEGIPTKHLPYLFDRFYRVENARSRSTGGAGLGLAIAYEIARLHGGSISVESQPQQETTFSVFFPC
jgi:heavy metal sensor kinase